MTCSFTAAGIFARRTRHAMRAVIYSTPLATVPADHAMPTYCWIQKCPIMPIKPTSADA
jgi:hypothetical protein